MEETVEMGVMIVMMITMHDHNEIEESKEDKAQINKVAWYVLNNYDEVQPYVE